MDQNTESIDVRKIGIKQKTPAIVVATETAIVVRLLFNGSCYSAATDTKIIALYVKRFTYSNYFDLTTSLYPHLHKSLHNLSWEFIEVKYVLFVNQ